MNSVNQKSALPPALQSALLGSGGSLLGNSHRLLTTPSSSTSQQAAVNTTPSPALPNKILSDLGSSFSSAFSRNWGIPQVTTPLSANEIHFLKNVKVSDLRPGNTCGVSNNPILQFFVQVLISVGTQAVVSGINNALTHSDSESKSNASRSPASNDPSVETMKTISSEAIESRIQKTVTHIIEDELNDLCKGASKATRAANEIFIKNAGKVISHQIETAVLFSKAHEIGWKGAVIETAKEASISFITHYPAETAALACGIIGPEAIPPCALAFNLIFSSIFETTPVASGLRNTQPFSPPSLNNVTSPNLPNIINNLNPPYPAWQPTKNH